MKGCFVSQSMICRKIRVSKQIFQSFKIPVRISKEFKGGRILIVDISSLSISLSLSFPK